LRQIQIAAALALVTLASCSRSTALAPVPHEPPRAQRLTEILQARQGDGNSADTVIGPGDLLQLRVYQMPELTGQFRVSEEGHIVLPLLGSVSLSGLTERQAEEKLRAELHDFVKQPAVTLAVGEIHGSQVSVVGAVAKPGVYGIHGSQETIADALTEAGGLTREAGTKIYFSPGAEAADGGKGRAAAALRLAATPGLIANPDRSLAIDLVRLYQGKTVPELAIPLRPGDSILVPAAGEIFVDGWVNQPGAFPLTRAMTLTQAIDSAGGIHFAAATGGVTVHRTSLEGEAESIRVDYAGILAGYAPDVFLSTGDRIEVSSNPLKVAPWAVYSFVKSVFSFGVGGNVGTVGAR